MKCYDVYGEAVKRLPPGHIDHHDSDLYIKVTPESRLLVEEYRKKIIEERGAYADTITTFRSIHPDDKDALWYEIPFHYTPYWDKRGCK